VCPQSKNIIGNFAGGVFFLKKILAIFLEYGIMKDVDGDIAQPG
jgi:hypothetical protein